MIEKIKTNGLKKYLWEVNPFFSMFIVCMVMSMMGAVVKGAIGTTVRYALLRAILGWLSFLLFVTGWGFVLLAIKLLIIDVLKKKDLNW